eukprot:m.564881 g.564881  ORF g.564881 m.564881 type:complete len:126 (+) comp57821_c1_seq11:581-958(+)
MTVLCAVLPCTLSNFRFVEERERLQTGLHIKPALRNPTLSSDQSEVTVEGGCGLVLSEQLDSLAEEGKELIVEDPISEDAPSVVLEACCDDIGGEQPSESEPLPPTPALALMNLALTEEDFELPP